MNIALVTKDKENNISLELYNEDLQQLTKESFEDIYTLNFYLQTIPKKFKENKTLIIFTDIEKLQSMDYNSRQIQGKNGPLKLFLAKDENSYFIQQ